MKIAIFENEYESVRFAFEAANLINFDDKLEFKIFPSSQTSESYNMEDYEVIFIDIDLSSKSILDGYGLIKKITDKNKNLHNRIVVLTGNNKISESLSSMGINTIALQILIKPTDYEQISIAINKVLSKKII